jgi:hypothetical protein
MKMFRELTAQTTRKTAARLLDALDGHLAPGWRRGHDYEEQLGTVVGGAGSTRCFICTSAALREAGALWVSMRDDGSLWVSNIVPEERTELSMEQYNRIIEEFAEATMRPAAEALGVEVELTTEDLSIADLAGQEPAERLMRFARSANKFTGTAHPVDRERWNLFVIAAHESDSELSAEDLGRYLVEEEGWPEDVADRLAMQYESARSLLKDHDRSFPHAAAGH